MVSVSPALSANGIQPGALPLLVTFREKMCRPFCIDSSVQPQASVTYTTGTPVMNGTTVFVPITAVVSVVTSGCGCKANTQLFTERFVAAFQDETTLPTAVSITAKGRTQGGSCVKCGKAFGYTINDSIVVSITPVATA